LSKLGKATEKPVNDSGRALDDVPYSVPERPPGFHGPLKERADKNPSKRTPSASPFWVSSTTVECHTITVSPLVDSAKPGSFSEVHIEPYKRPSPYPKIVPADKVSGNVRLIVPSFDMKEQPFHALSVK
jgi:hypothetical protein